MPKGAACLKGQQKFPNCEDLRRYKCIAQKHGINTKVIYLSPINFITGTYRIKESAIYILLEDISFDPTLTRENLPLSSFWF